MSKASQLKNLSRIFSRQGTSIYRHHPPLYERLTLGVAGDVEMLELASHARGDPLPNLFLAAAHSLLLGSLKHPIARFYPNISGNAPMEGDPYPPFVPLLRLSTFERDGERQKVLARCEDHGAWIHWSA